MNIGYKLVKNAMSATADKAPYLGMAVPVGSLAYDNILKDMIKTGTRLSLPTARFFLEAFYEFAAERIAEEVVRINTGTVAIYPRIDGSFDSEDADFDPERNSLYIGATLSQSLRDRVAGIVPDATGDETKGTVKMDRIYDIGSQTRGVISGTNPFRISGRNLTVPDAEDESLALYAKDGVTKVTDIVVTETDGGQLITCKLSAAVGVPKGTYKVRIASHGLDPTDPLTVATLTVTLVEPIPAPSGPRITGVGGLAGDDRIAKHGQATVSFEGAVHNSLTSATFAYTAGGERKTGRFYVGNWIDGASFDIWPDDSSAIGELPTGTELEATFELYDSLEPDAQKTAIVRTVTVADDVPVVIDSIGDGGTVTRGEAFEITGSGLTPGHSGGVRVQAGGAPELIPSALVTVVSDAKLVVSADAWTEVEALANAEPGDSRTVMVTNDAGGGSSASAEVGE